MTSMVGRLVKYRSIRQITYSIEDNGNQVSDGQRMNLNSWKGRLELEVMRF